MAAKGRKKNHQEAEKRGLGCLASGFPSILARLLVSECEVLVLQRNGEQRNGLTSGVGEVEEVSGFLHPNPNGTYLRPLLDVIPRNEIYHRGTMNAET